MQTQRTCSTFNVGAVEREIGMASALLAARAANAAEESRMAIGFPIEASMSGFVMESLAVPG
ncbi:hypothetical protein AC629_38725 [Bradyrhizobium sp. NAS80.1]|nr:hypothetical protein AC629_38725 [Bradyrhizobium sp. NAS80.1]